MKTVLFVILTAAITNNYVLVKFLGICPFLGVSKKLDQATGMSIAVIFVEVLATAVTWPIYHLLLAGKVDFTYMETVVFILVIAALVQLVEIVLKRYIPSLHKALGVYLPLITTNCGVLGVTMNNISDGLNYVDSLLTALGCKLAAPAPALAPIETEKAPLRGLSGLRLPATLTLCDGDQPIARTQGEVLFADYGVSGVCAMQLARDAQRLLSARRQPMLYLDFSPTMGIGAYRMARLEPGRPDDNLPAVRAFLKRRAQILPNDALLLGALPRLLRERMAAYRGEELARMLCAYPLRVTGVRGYDQAQVTQGGIDPADFDPATMACKKHPGLYACGEILNVDGDCGGYNLQFAFATGLLAARDAAK